MRSILLALSLFVACLCQLVPTSRIAGQEAPADMNPPKRQAPLEDEQFHEKLKLDDKQFHEEMKQWDERIRESEERIRQYEEHRRWSQERTQQIENIRQFWKWAPWWFLVIVMWIGVILGLFAKLYKAWENRAKKLTNAPNSQSIPRDGK